MERVFLDAFLTSQDEVTLSDLASAIELGDLARAEAVVDWEKFDEQLRPAVREILQTLVGEAGKLAARALGRKLKITARFDLLNPRAVQFIREHTGELITQISEESRQAIRSIVRRAFEEGKPPAAQARKIRQYIGLTERQMHAVENYWRRLTEEGLRSARRVDEMTENYAKRLLRDRAKMIARNETLTAANAGQHESWLQAADAGLIDPGKFQREWITTPDDRICNLCLEMDGKLAPIDAPFDTPAGSIMRPPLHVQCRCAAGLRRVKP